MNGRKLDVEYFFDSSDDKNNDNVIL